MKQFIVQYFIQTHLRERILRKNAVLLDSVQITSPPSPNLTTCTTFFGRQNSRFESQFRTKNTIYILCIKWC